MSAMTALLVDDNESFRQSTAWLLEGAGLHVRTFENGPALLEALSQFTPPIADTCIVTDLRMPVMSGLELIEELRQRRVSLPVIMITGHGDVPLAVEAMRRGAANFIEKPFDGHTFIETVKNAILEPGSGLRNPAVTRSKLERLSPRERQVMELVCAGKLNKTIADILGISIKTVELHRANMAAKLGIRNIQDLVRLTLGYE